MKKTSILFVTALLIVFASCASKSKGQTVGKMDVVKNTYEKQRFL